MGDGVQAKAVLRVLAGEKLTPPPIWMMRQAGRYLPEYREVRAKAGSFLDLCYAPELAAEVTLQPIRRFGFDAAILFSDILVVPHALGQAVSFEAGEGPRLDPIPDAAAVARLSPVLDAAITQRIYEAIGLIRAQLPASCTFLGFCGAPWTVATYMVAGQGTDDQGPARLFAYRDPDGFERLIDRLVEASITYLVGQFRAGVDAVQVFDTWAGVLPPAEFRRWAIEPVRRICEGVRAEVPGARMIGFPRGAAGMLAAYAAAVPVDAVGLDWAAVPEAVNRDLRPGLAVQGHVDPLALIAGGAALDRAVDAVLEGFAGRPLVFNLGHGIRPETPIAHVAQMIARVRG